MPSADSGFELDISEMLQFVRNTKNKMPRVLATAVNRSSRSAKVAMAKAVRADIGGIKAADVKKAIRFISARPSLSPTARILSPQRRISLIKFGARQLKRAGVRTRLKRGTKSIPGAFIATGFGGEKVFKRSGKTQYPVEELFGPSLAKPFSRHWKTVGVRRYREQLTKNVKSGLANAARRG